MVIALGQDGFAEIFLCGKSVRGVVASVERISQTAQIRIISFRIICRFGSYDLLFLAGEFCPQLVGYSFSYLTFDRKDVGQFSVKGVSPKMRIVSRFD